MSDISSLATHEKEIWIRVVFALAPNVTESSSCLMLKIMLKYSKIHCNLRGRGVYSHVSFLCIASTDY